MEPPFSGQAFPERRRPSGRRLDECEDEQQQNTRGQDHDAQAKRLRAAAAGEQPFRALVARLGGKLQGQLVAASDNRRPARR